MEQDVVLRFDIIYYLHTCSKAGEILNCICIQVGHYEHFLSFNAKEHNTGTKNAFQASVFDALGGIGRVKFRRIGEVKVLL